MGRYEQGGAEEGWCWARERAVPLLSATDLLSLTFGQKEARLTFLVFLYSPPKFHPCLVFKPHLVIWVRLTIILSMHSLLFFCPFHLLCEEEVRFTHKEVEER